MHLPGFSSPTAPLLPDVPAPLSAPEIQRALEAHAAGRVPRLERLWGYYRNAMAPGAAGDDGRGYRLAQERGLPARITGGRGLPRREVVVENDIAWRIQTMVDFLLARPVQVRSTAREEGLRDVIDRVLDRVWERSGGIALLQDMALLGHVYGHVDLTLRVDDEALAAAAVAGGGDPLDVAMRAGEALTIDLIETRRGVPLLDPHDYRKMRGYVIHHNVSGAEPRGVLARLVPAWRTEGPETLTEVITAGARVVYRNGRVVWRQRRSDPNGEVPVVHIQNIAEPFAYEGHGEVEPLIPLQDELNTRLSDRACRVTMQSFKMYLVKGLEGFDKGAVGPGQMWTTENMEASIAEFGGDASSPSEESHIRQVREALDKASGVPPLASGVVQAKIGNLSSANALRITLMAILSKTARKRVTYGGGIERMCRLVLSALHEAGALETDETDRSVRIVWPDPLPIDEREQVQAAEGKARLGVPRERVLAELGYGPDDPGVQ